MVVKAHGKAQQNRASDRKPGRVWSRLKENRIAVGAKLKSVEFRCPKNHRGLAALA